ncbi:NmrA family NAD(P)-binding protein [Sphaerisporangium fuscum]|uniref:NmrA family NAD(P)-binding protein n=1 Tax=Sphaerisporangium fuscum TaxID=2835868 RepID=UPI001BDC9405|nr:NAD(P)H-binding protein [Sphaerisporangium fuscum]
MRNDTQGLEGGTTLVLGGTGKTGRRVVERLAARGLPVRVGSRGGTPPFDWQDETTWQPALQEVQAVYVTYVPDLAFPGATEKVEAFSALAVREGVRRLVLLSGRGEEAALLAEEVVRNAGAEWTIVRASWFNQNFDEGMLLPAVIQGEIAFPAGDTPEPFIDADDLADVAVAALTDGRHAGQVYEVSGPRLLTFGDAAMEIGKALGRDVRYVPISAEQYAAALAENGGPVEFAELVAEVLDGRNAYLSDGVRRALGREPRDFADYARETAASGVWTG